MDTLIISGGNIGIDLALGLLKIKRFDHIIGVDGGLKFCYDHKIVPTRIVGDFDTLSPEILTWYKKNTQIEIREYNPVKDATDTQIAVELALSLGSDHVTILGGTGTRLDHVLGNIAILGQGFVQDRHIFLLDEHNRIRLIQKECRIKKEEQYGKYVSVVSFCGVARGVSESGVFYPLDHVDLQPFTSLGISNEIVDEEAVITVEDGTLIVIESKD